MLNEKQIEKIAFKLLKKLQIYQAVREQASEFVTVDFDIDILDEVIDLLGIPSGYRDWLYISWYENKLAPMKFIRHAKKGKDEKL